MRKVTPPSKNLAEQQAKRAAKQNDTANTEVLEIPVKEKQSPLKKVALPAKNKSIATKETVKDNNTVKSKPVKEKKTILKKVALVKKTKEKPTEPTPMTDKQITDSILEDIKKKDEAKVVEHAPEPIAAQDSDTNNEDLEPAVLPEEEPKEEVAIILANDGEGIDKPFTPFPQMEMTNTTILMINAYKIDCPKLPATILNEVNKLSVLLNSFKSEGRVELISQLQGQDGITSQLLSTYVTEKGLVQAVIAGGVPPQAQAGIQFNSASPLPPVQYQTPEFLANNPSNGSPAQVMQIDQQGLAKRIITDINYAKDCAEHLMVEVRKDWRLDRWGYIPLSVLNDMIATTNNQFKYEVVLDAFDFKNSFVKVISPEGVAETEKFGIQ